MLAPADGQVSIKPIGAVVVAAPMAAMNTALGSMLSAAKVFGLTNRVLAMVKHPNPGRDPAPGIGAPARQSEQFFQNPALSDMQKAGVSLRPLPASGAVILPELGRSVGGSCGFIFLLWEGLIQCFVCLVTKYLVILQCNISNIVSYVAAPCWCCWQGCAGPETRWVARKRTP